MFASGDSFVGFTPVTNDDGKKIGDIEAYQHDRYLTITGQVWGDRGQVQEIFPDLLAWFWETHIRPPKPKQQPRATNNNQADP
ncbi:MAG: hypothetical protein Q8O19_03030, partial [Rectinemataceae bacterium]|nr:hypothetical protein [Rectinemataceae bacterium]